MLTPTLTAVTWISLAICGFIQMALHVAEKLIEYGAIPLSVSDDSGEFVVLAS